MTNTRLNSYYVKFILVFILIVLASTIKGQDISTMLVGNNVWYKNPSEKVWDLTKKGGVTSLRIGGAEYSKNMPANAELLNWVKYIQSMGAEPIMQVSQYGTPEQAAALVNYFNVDLASGKKIKYWNIGNEPWLQAGRPAVSTAGALVEKYYKPIAIAMKSADSTLKIFGPDYCYYIDEGINDLFGGKNDISGKIPGKNYYYCDGISWHNYPQGNGSPAYDGVESFKSGIIKCKAKVDEVNKLRNRTGSDALLWGIGEYNSKGGPEVHTWDNGQIFGAVLGMCMQYEATYAASWSMFESSGNRQGTDFSFIDGDMTPRASYRHMELISKNFKGRYLKGTSSLKDIIVFGSKNGDTLSVIIMNRSSANPVSYALHMNSTDKADKDIQLNIDAGSDLSYKDIIIGKSTQVLVFKDGKIIKTNYSSFDFDHGKPPVQSMVLQAKNAPSEPSSLTCSTLSTTSILLEWSVNKADTVTGFLIERKQAKNSEFEQIAFVDNSAHSFTDTKLIDSTGYTYRIKAYNTAGKSGFSNENSATTLKIYLKAYNGPHSIPGKIEAEDFNNNNEGIGYHDAEPANQGKSYRLDQGVDIEACTDVDGGYNVGYISKGEWLSYSLENIIAGEYDISLRVASNVDGNNKVKVYLGDAYLGYFVPKLTGGWQKWQTLYIKNIDITQTDNKLLKLNFDGGDFNINWIEFAKNISPSGFQKFNENSGFVKIHPNPANENIKIDVALTFEKSDYSIYNLTGNAIKKGTITRGNNQLDISRFENGVYLIKIVVDSAKVLTRRIIKI